MTVKKTKAAKTTQKPAKKSIKWYEEAVELLEFLLDEFSAENESLMKAIKSKDRAYTQLKDGIDEIMQEYRDRVATEYSRGNKYYDRSLKLQNELDSVKSDRNFFIGSTVVMIIAFLFSI